MSSIVLRPGLIAKTDRMVLIVIAQVAVSPFTPPGIVDIMLGEPVISMES